MYFQYETMLKLKNKAQKKAFETNQRPLKSKLLSGKQ